jgi:hypothetical protein
MVKRSGCRSFQLNRFGADDGEKVWQTPKKVLVCEVGNGEY